jgi:hypothetical protein
MNYVRYALLLIAAVLYITSLHMTYLVGSHNVPTTGYTMAAVGYFDIAFNGIFSWLANPLAIAAIIFAIFEKGLRPLVLSSAAFVLGLQYVLYQGKTISFFDSNGPFGTLGPGYYVWELSFLVLAIACFIAYRQSKSSRAN